MAGRRLGYAPILGGEFNTTLEAKSRLTQLQNQLSSQNLKSSGLSRMAVLEFSKLGGSMTTLGNKALPAEAVTQEFQRLSDQATRVQANIKASGGQPLDSTYSGYADPRYGDKIEPLLHRGASGRGGARAFGSAGSGRGAEHYGECAGFNSRSGGHRQVAARHAVYDSGRT